VLRSRSMDEWGLGVREVGHVQCTCDAEDHLACSMPRSLPLRPMHFRATRCTLLPIFSEQHGGSGLWGGSASLSSGRVRPGHANNHMTTEVSALTDKRAVPAGVGSHGTPPRREHTRVVVSNQRREQSGGEQYRCHSTACAS
jgi:hypothetical protein